MSNATVPFVQILRQLFNVVSASALALSQQYSPSKSNYFTVTIEESQNVEATGLVRNGESSHRTALPSSPPSDSHEQPSRTERARKLSPIEELMWNPTLFDPVRKPRYPIVLCHGLYGFDVRGPSSFPGLQLHYWANVLRVLKTTIGAEVIVTGVPGTGSIAERAHAMHTFLSSRASGRALNFIAHSMGGLDCRYLISRVRKDIKDGRAPQFQEKARLGLKTSEGIEEDSLDGWGDFEGWSDLDAEHIDGDIGIGSYVPVSLTTICTPHRGSPVMDWFVDNIGIGKPSSIAPSKSSQSADAKDGLASLSMLTSLSSSFTTLLLSLLDTPAYANLTTQYANEVFNPSTPDDPSVRYYSVGARVDGVGVWHPLWFPKMVMDGAEEKAKRQSSSGFHLSDERGNDGLVSVQSAKWGEFLGVVEGCDHWAIRGSRGIGIDSTSFPSLGLGSLSMPSLSIPSLISFGEVVPSSIRNSFGEFGMWKRETSKASVTGGPNEADNGVGWSWLDWSQFVRTWRREEAHATKNQNSQGKSEETNHTRSNDTKDIFGIRAETISGTSTQRMLSQKPLYVDEEQDEVVKSSTDKLSKVFDWIVEHSPTSSSSESNQSTRASDIVDARASSEGDARVSHSKLNERSPQSRIGSESTMCAHTSGASQSDPTSVQDDSHATHRSPHFMAYPVAHSSNRPQDRPSPLSFSSRPGHSISSSHELQSSPSKGSNPKFDLEKFYVALCRRLYDDGF